MRHHSIRTMPSLGCDWQIGAILQPCVTSRTTGHQCVIPNNHFIQRYVALVIRPILQSAETSFFEPPCSDFLVKKKNRWIKGEPYTWPRKNTLQDWQPQNWSIGKIFDQVVSNYLGQSPQMLRGVLLGYTPNLGPFMIRAPRTSCRIRASLFLVSGLSNKSFGFEQPTIRRDWKCTAPNICSSIFFCLVLPIHMLLDRPYLRDSLLQPKQLLYRSYQWIVGP